MQNSPVDPLFIDIVIILIGVITTFIGSEVIDETIESIEEDRSRAFGRKMELLYNEKRNSWYLLGFGLFMVGWSILIIGIYGSCQMLLLRYPNLIFESTVPWIFGIIIGILVLFTKINLVTKIPVKTQSNSDSVV